MIDRRGKAKRGVVLTISQELFDRIIAKGLGLEPDKMEVWHVTNAFHNHAFQVTLAVDPDDERFPIVPEGTRFPEGALELSQDENGVRVMGVHLDA